MFLIYHPLPPMSNLHNIFIYDFLSSFDIISLFFKLILPFCLLLIYHYLHFQSAISSFSTKERYCVLLFIRKYNIFLLHSYFGYTHHTAVLTPSHLTGEAPFSPLYKAQMLQALQMCNLPKSCPLVALCHDLSTLASPKYCV